MADIMQLRLSIRAPWADVRAILFFILMGVLLTINGANLSKGLREKKAQRARRPYIFWGIKFAGLSEALKDVKRVGYFTSKDLNDHFTALQFAQAQYALAPVILELDDTNHEYLILNYDNPILAIAKAKTIGAKPLKMNPFGVVLAQRPFEKNP
jgi:hypothetical protein